MFGQLSDNASTNVKDPSIVKKDGNVDINAIFEKANRNFGYLLQHKMRQIVQSSPEIKTGSKINHLDMRIADYNRTTSNNSSSLLNNRDSLGQINFQKPVSKLVNNVAQAIGESVRRMEPRSMQRGSLIDITKQDKLRKGESRQAKSSYANMKTRKCNFKSNSLINRIQRITEQSHTEITENEMLKLNLENLTQGPNSKQSSNNNTFVINSKLTRSSNYKPKITKGDHLVNKDLCIITQNNNSKISITKLDNSPAVLPYKKFSPKEQLTSFDDKFIAKDESKSANISLTVDQQEQFTQLMRQEQEICEPLQVSRKPILQFKGGNKNLTQSRFGPNTRSRVTQITSNQLKVHPQPISTQTDGELQSGKVKLGSKQADLAGVTEAGDILSPQCSTAREIYFKEENVSTSLNIFDMRTRKNQKILSTNQSHSIFTEQGQPNRATTPSQQPSRAATPSYIKLCPANYAVRGQRETNISPKERVFSESAMAPVYIDLQPYEKIINGYFSINSGKVSPIDQRESRLEQTQTVEQLTQLGFEGLLIQSQEVQGIEKKQISQVKKNQVANMYALLKPTQWLQNAMRRGQKLRKIAHQQTIFLIQQQNQVAPSPVSYRADSAENRGVFISEISYQNMSKGGVIKDSKKADTESSPTFVHSKEKASQQFRPSISNLRVQCKQIQVPPEIKNFAFNSRIQMRKVAKNAKQGSVEDDYQKQTFIGVLGESPKIQLSDENIQNAIPTPNDFASEEVKKQMQSILLLTNEDAAHEEKKELFQEMKKMNEYKHYERKENLVEGLSDDPSYKSQKMSLVEFKVVPSKIHRMIPESHNSLQSRSNAASKCQQDRIYTRPTRITNDWRYAKNQSPSLLKNIQALNQQNQGKFEFDKGSKCKTQQNFILKGKCTISNVETSLEANQSNIGEYNKLEQTLHVRKPTFMTDNNSLNNKRQNEVKNDCQEVPSAVLSRAQMIQLKHNNSTATEDLGQETIEEGYSEPRPLINP